MQPRERQKIASAVMKAVLHKSQWNNALESCSEIAADIGAEGLELIEDVSCHGIVLFRPEVEVRFSTLLG